MNGFTALWYDALEMLEPTTALLYRRISTTVDLRNVLIDRDAHTILANTGAVNGGSCPHGAHYGWSLLRA